MIYCELSGVHIVEEYNFGSISESSCRWNFPSESFRILVRKTTAHDSLSAFHRTAPITVAFHDVDCAELMYVVNAPLTASSSSMVQAAEKCLYRNERVGEIHQALVALPNK